MFIRTLLKCILTERNMKKKLIEVLIEHLRYSEDSIDTLLINSTDISLTLSFLEIIGMMTKLNDTTRKVEVDINM